MRAQKAANAHDALFKALSLLKNPQEVAQFLSDLCTPAELDALADRWGVVEPLKAEKSYRQIHEETGVSVTTIGRVARSIQYGQGGYDLVYERFKRPVRNF